MKIGISTLIDPVASMPRLPRTHSTAMSRALVGLVGTIRIT